MDQNQLVATVAEILEIDSNDVSLEDSLEDLGWDSLCAISFIAAVNEATGKTVPSADLKACSTVADLVALA